MLQERLFRLAVEAVVIQAVFVPGEGWRLVIQSRHQGEQWEPQGREDYHHLTTPELADVVCEEVGRRLGLT